MGSYRALLTSSHPKASSASWPSSRLAISNPFGASIPQEQKHGKTACRMQTFSCNSMYKINITNRSQKAYIWLVSGSR